MNIKHQTSKIKQGPTTAALSRERLRDPKLWLGVKRELHLSDREVQVAVLLVLGRSLSQIAEQLGIRKYTVVTYERRLHRKAKTHSRAELVTQLLLSSGLLLGDGGRDG